LASETVSSAKNFQAREVNVQFVIWSFSYDETVGGIIALHTLCDRLNEAGVRASIWPHRRPPVKALKGWRGLVRYAAYLARDFVDPFDPGPFPKRIARHRDLKNAIVVYPEVVAGNPLESEKVVRWFLYRPGDHQVSYGSNELYFSYNDTFSDASINPNLDNILRVTTIFQAYTQTNFGERTGSCYLVRKNEGRAVDKHPPDSIQIDGLSHEKIAKLFNEKKYFYSYDLYSFYSVYAALCGCISVVIPKPGLSRDEWHPSPDRQLGIAYGTSDIARALATRAALIERMKVERVEEDAQVRMFVEKCFQHFGA